MPQALGGLGGIFSSLSSIPNWAKAILGGMTGLGEVGNILADRQRGQLLNKEKEFINLTPQQLSGRVAAATQPLSQGLTEGVTNEVQGALGERGLAQAPGIFQSVLAQALAPYYQQNQNTALNEILAQMGLPIQAASLVAPQQNLSPLMALLLGSLTKPTAAMAGVGAGGGTGGGGTPPIVGDTEGSNWFGDFFNSLTPSGATA